MELIQKSRDVLTMKYPASWHGALWREGLLTGNGQIGANVYGGTKRETVLINHSHLWSGDLNCELPDVSDSLQKTRELMDKKEFLEASWTLTNALKEKGYDNKRSFPLPLGELSMVFSGLPGFSNYLRAVNMKTGEVSSQFKEGDAWVRKDLFVSRADDMIIMQIRAEAPILNAEFKLDMRKDQVNGGAVYEHVKENRKIRVEDNLLLYSCVNTDGLEYGAVACVESVTGIIEAIGEDIATADKGAEENPKEGFTEKSQEGSIKVSGASDILVKIKVFVKGQGTVEALKKELKAESGDYQYYLDRHVPLHQKLYCGADLQLGEPRDLSNEELLLEAYGEGSSEELIEKLWRHGRYLFVCGCGEESLPFPMYGLWAGGYKSLWSLYVANENVQMLHWHINVGNLLELNKPLFAYYNNSLDAFRENAKKLYGCKGIFVPSGTTPNIPYPIQVVPVIMNWTGTAGWLARHYYDYYSYTKDTECLHSTILPFMMATAEFYEDFITYDENGTIKFYPSISPENTPVNFMPKNGENIPHPMPTTINSTIDLAIIKELFTNLLKVSREQNVFQEKRPRWEKIIASIPEYQANVDGAVKEWQDEQFEDRYFHRHLSHIYPVFPGNEISTQDDRLPMFEKAVDLRDIGAQTGWSLAHMAAIYARFGRGNDAMQCLDNLAKVCVQNNFVSLHNDWRRMDISLEMESGAPIQMDAAMGYVNAVQEMLLYSSEKLVKLLPALPDNLSSGLLTNWRFVGGTVSMEWNLAGEGSGRKFGAVMVADRAVEISVELPKFLWKDVSTAFADNALIVEGGARVTREGNTLRAVFEPWDTLVIRTEKVNIFKKWQQQQNNIKQ